MIKKRACYHHHRRPQQRLREIINSRRVGSELRAVTLCFLRTATGPHIVSFVSLFVCFTVSFSKHSSNLPQHIFPKMWSPQVDMERRASQQSALSPTPPTNKHGRTKSLSAISNFNAAMNINAGGPGGGTPMSPVRMGSPLIGPGGAVEFEWADIQARLVMDVGLRR